MYLVCYAVTLAAVGAVHGCSLIKDLNMEAYLKSHMFLVD
jgi:hypothetical protein